MVGCKGPAWQWLNKVGDLYFTAREDLAILALYAGFRRVYRWH